MLRAQYRARAACPYLPGAQKLRSEAHLQVRLRWTFYEAIKSQRTNTEALRSKGFVLMAKEKR
jgi:hypothetical protein